VDEREPSVDTVFAVVVGQRAEEEASEGGSEPVCIRVPLAIGETPGGQVVRCEVLREEAVTTR
jgi:hypothetical protein